MGFIEAGASDFFVPRGYVHVIANLRGTGGSGGTFGLFDGQERHDMHDLVEWAAAQPWCDGNVGMIGISYFAMTQLEAAVERPPHLKAIFPVAVTADLYEGAMHHGLLSSAFITPFLAMVGLIAAAHGDKLWRAGCSTPPGTSCACRRSTRSSPRMNGEAALTVLKLAHARTTTRIPGTTSGAPSRSSIPPATRSGTSATCSPRSARSTSRSTSAATGTTCPCTCRAPSRPGSAWRATRTCGWALLGRYGLTWPWESLHLEALAWFDHWLKDRDTGHPRGPADPLPAPGRRRSGGPPRLAAARGAHRRARAATPTARLAGATAAGGRATTCAWGRD